MFTSPLFARFWHKSDAARESVWQSLWAMTQYERLRLRCMTDALVAQALALDTEKLAWILRDCDRPAAQMRDRVFTGKLDPKGFWRVDKEREPELRHTVLAQVAFADLQKQGLDVFLTGTNGGGWQLPETLRLADYALGHDDRAREHQPVASRLGPPFLHWQLEKDPATSWAECEAHAALLDQLWRHARSLNNDSDVQIPTVDPSAAPPKMRNKKSVSDQQTEFGLI
jgi:hypothetical protein